MLHATMLPVPSICGSDSYKLTLQLGKELTIRLPTSRIDTFRVEPILNIHKYEGRARAMTPDG